ncbi:MAG: terminase small subunit-like protein, partial [Phenylobacterium sp.]
VAHEIVTRVSEGETLTSIADDPAMPSMGTIFYWRKSKPEFAEDLRVAREALAERFSDLGWRMAQAATPETAHLTRVRLGQLRWNAAILSPRTHARLRPAEPPTGPEVHDVILKLFEIETHPETGQHRVIAYHADPDTMLPVIDRSGPWKDPVDPIAKAAALEDLAQRRALKLKHNLPDHPKSWR